MLWYYVLLVGTFVGSPLLTVSVPFFIYLIVMFPWSSNIIHIKTAENNGNEVQCNLEDKDIVSRNRQSILHCIV